MADGQQQDPQVTAFLTALHSAMQNIMQQHPGMDQSTAQQMAMNPGSIQYQQPAAGEKKPRTGYDVDPGAFNKSPSGGPSFWEQLRSIFPGGANFGSPDWSFGFGGTARELGGKQQDSKPPAKPAAAKPATQADPAKTISPTDDALTMGIGMFFQQYLAPMMAQQNTANQQLIGQYGTAMNQALQNPMPAGVKQVLSASLPQQQQLMAMQNRAGEQQAFGTIPYQQFVQGMGQQSAAMQALQDAFSKAATYYELGVGSPTGLAGALQTQLGGPNTLAGSLAGLIGQGASTGLPPVPGLPGTLQPNAAQAAQTSQG